MACKRFTMDIMSRCTIFLQGLQSCRVFFFDTLAIAIVLLVLFVTSSILYSSSPAEWNHIE